MSSLHELLAVKKDAAQRGNEISGETKKVFGAKHLFAGSLKTYTPFNEEDTVRFADEHETLSHTVGEKMQWFGENIGRIIDIEYQIDLSNASAAADLQLGDTVINDVPATFLLDLISYLGSVRKTYAAIPVLDPKYQWEEDFTEAPGVFRTTKPEVTFRSQKVLRHKVLVEADEHHPAQVEKWPEDVQVGEYTKQMWSGALTTAQKAAVLGRIDKLTESAKKALSKANNVEHSREKIASQIFSYLHEGIVGE